MIDQPDFEAEAIATAAADLGDRIVLARLTVLETGPFAKTEADHHEADGERRFMTWPDMIVERMARDILAARRDGQHGHLIDLTEYGWTQAQAMRWGAAAHEASRSLAVATQDAVERLAAREGMHLVTVASIDVDRIVAAGEAAVAAAVAHDSDDFGGDAA